MSLWHPSFRRLSQFAARADGESVAPGLARHLQHCPRCRRVVVDLRGLPAWMQDAPLPNPDPQVWERIVTRLDQGEVVLGPTDDALTPARSTSRRILLPLLAAASVVLCLVVLDLLMAPSAYSAQAELRFLPRIAQPGQMVQVEYRAVAPLSRYRSLVLRSRFRRASDQPRISGIDNLPATTLGRDKDGVFRGEFRFPDSAVYAAFAVEDSTGDVIDTDGGRHWSLGVGTAAGLSASAMQQRAYDQMEYDFAAAVVTLREAARRFKDDPWRWAILRASAPETPQALLESRTRYDQLHAALLHQRTLPVGALEGMMLLGMLSQHEGMKVDSTNRARYLLWRDRLIENYPASWYAVDQRLISWMEYTGTGRPEVDNRELLQRLDSLWALSRTAQPRLLTSALRTAIVTRDSAEVRRWAQRWLAARPWEAPMIAAQLARSKQDNALAIAIVRQQLSDIAGSSERMRPLHVTRTEQHRRDTSRRQEALLLFGQLLIAAGEQSEGLDSMRVAATLAPNVEVARVVARALEHAGDSLGSARIGALVALDPIAPAAVRDSVDRRGRRLLGNEGWHARLDAVARSVASEEQGRRVDRALALDGVRVRIDGAEGDRPAMSEFGAPVTLALFWDPWCPYVQGMTPTLMKLYPLLVQQGVKVVLIATTSNDWIASYRDSKAPILDVPILYDPERIMSRAFRAVGTPAFGIVVNGKLQAPVGDDVRAAVRSSLFRANQLRGSQ